LSAECASERIIKIGQYLAKIWTKVRQDGAFFGPRRIAYYSAWCATEIFLKDIGK